jgi:hypothetical protein
MFALNFLYRLDEVVENPETKEKSIINYCKKNKKFKVLKQGKTVMEALANVKQMNGPLHEYDVVIEKKGKVILENSEFIRIKNLDGTIEQIYKDGRTR